MRGKTGIRVAAVAAATATALLAAGCSGGGTSAHGGGDATAAGPVDLTYWSWAPGMDKVADVWNKAHPNIHVTVNKQDGGDAAVTKLLTATKAGSGAPDIMQAEYQAIPTLVAANALADMSGNLDQGLQSKFNSSVWNSVTLGSKAVYAVPQDSGPMMFYYRADVFNQLHLPVPTTWDEYAQVAAQVHHADPTKYLGTFSATDAGWFKGLAQQAGASWWGVKGGSWSVKIDDAATQKVAQYWGGLVASGAIDNKPMYTPEWNAALNDGSQIGWVSAVWAPGVLQGNAPNTAGKWKAAPLPQWDSSHPATGEWGGSATAITTQSKHPKQDAEFITWLNSSQAGVNALVTDSGVYPADVSAEQEALAQPPAFFANQPDFYDIAAKTAKTANSFTYGPNVNVAYSAYNDAFGKAAQQRNAAAFGQAVSTMQQVTVEDMKNSGFKVVAQ